MKKGFTLMELMTVVMIMSMLAGFAITKLGGVSELQSKKELEYFHKTVMTKIEVRVNTHTQDYANVFNNDSNAPYRLIRRNLSKTETMEVSLIFTKNNMPPINLGRMVLGPNQYVSFSLYNYVWNNAHKKYRPYLVSGLYDFNTRIRIREGGLTNPVDPEEVWFSESGRF